MKERARKLVGKTRKVVNKRNMSKMFIFLFFTILIYILILYVLFFVIGQNNPFLFVDHAYNSVNDIKNSDFSTYTDLEKEDFGEPINVVLITDKNLSNYFSDVGWQQAVPISRLSFRSFIKDTFNSTLPVSDLYYDNRKEDLAFQDVISLGKREHIRIWNQGHYINSSNKVYFGEVSYDTGFTLGIRSGFIVPLHKVNKNIDFSREYLFGELSSQGLVDHFVYIDSQNNDTSSKSFKYVTDGRALVIFLK